MCDEKYSAVEVSSKISESLHNYWEVLENITNIVISYEIYPVTIQSIKFMINTTVQKPVNLLIHPKENKGN